MEDRSNANMRIFKDPLPDHASGSKEIPINALNLPLTLDIIQGK